MPRIYVPPEPKYELPDYNNNGTTNGNGFTSSNTNSYYSGNNTNGNTMDNNTTYSRPSRNAHSPSHPNNQPAHNQSHNGTSHSHSRPSSHHPKSPQNTHRPHKRSPPKLSPWQAHLVAATGEFVGTFLFLYFAFGAQMMLATQASDASIQNGGTSSQTMIFTALVYGFSLLVNVWAFYRISGGLFNPAVTLGLVLSSALPPVRGLVLFPAQILGSLSAAGMARATFPGSILDCNTRLSPGTSSTAGLFIEMFMTAELVFVVLMLAAEKSKDTFIAPVGVGLALFVAMMGGVYYTGGSLNPTRSLAPAIAGRDFPGYHWIYWVGPFLGALLAAGYYRFVKWFNYEEVNPGQDSAGRDEEEGGS